ncbi:MAG: ABC-2 family transporter protein [Lachnospiraceae bacterium]|nr:ABC-2 family transporter protein [Lachnospiraceae bacterium]
MKLIKKILYYLDVTFTYLKMALLQIIEYPTSILGWLLSNPIQFLVGFATIKFVVAEFGSINGWNYGQLAFLYGLSVLSHALSMIFFVNGWFMGWWVISGDFDRILTRPMSVVYQFFFTNINVMGLTDLVPGIIVFAYGCHKVSFHWTFYNAFLILVMLIGATLIRGGIYIMLGSTTFWSKSTVDFGMFTQEIFDKTTMYPISMYPEGFQFVLTYLIPIGWVSFYPASSLLGIENGCANSTMAVWITLLVGIVTISIAAMIFKLGLKQYESAGN